MQASNTLQVHTAQQAQLDTGGKIKKGEVMDMPHIVSLSAALERNGDMGTGVACKRLQRREMFVSSFTVAAAIMGAGLLGIPHAISQASGWIGGFILLPVSAVMMAYTALLLHRCLMRAPYVHTYIDLGTYAAGKWGRWVIATAQLVSAFGSAVLLLVIGGQNLQGLVGGLSLQWWLVICSGAMYPAIFAKRLKEALAASVIGFASAALAGLVVVVYCFSEGVQGHHAPNVSHSPEFSFKNFTTAFGTFMLAWGSHTLFPRISIEMASGTRHRFSHSIFISFPIIAAFYASVGGTGYWIYGDGVEDNVLKSMGKNWAYYIANVSITIHVLMAYVIFLNPIFQIIEFYLGIGPAGRTRKMLTGTEIEVDIVDKEASVEVDGSIKVATSDISESSEEDEWRASDRLYSLALRTFIQGLTLFLGCLIPFIGDIMSFIGGSSITVTCVVCPIWFYLRLFSRKEVGGSLAVWAHIGIATIGMAVGLCSTIFSLENIVSNMGTYKLFGASG
eukprot:Nk52_evm5s2568 gene=Nk52_evmTU5s2568